MEVGSTEKLVFCKLLFQSPESTPDVEFCLQFSSDFFRKASYCGKDRATGQSTNVPPSKVPTPHMLNTGQDVVRAIDRMNSSKPGQGNPDDRFIFSLATFQERRSYWHIRPCMYIKNMTTTKERSQSEEILFPDKHTKWAILCFHEACIPTAHPK